MMKHAKRLLSAGTAAVLLTTSVVFPPAPLRPVNAAQEITVQSGGPVPETQRYANVFMSNTGSNNGNYYGGQRFSAAKLPAGRGKYDAEIGSSTGYGTEAPNLLQNDCAFVGDTMFTGSVYSNIHMTVDFQNPGEGLTVYGNLQTTDDIQVISTDSMQYSDMLYYRDIPYIYVDGTFSIPVRMIFTSTTSVNIYAGAIQSSETTVLSSFSGDIYLYDSNLDSTLISRQINLQRSYPPGSNLLVGYPSYNGEPNYVAADPETPLFGNLYCNNHSLTIGNDGDTGVIEGDLVFTNPNGKLIIAGGLEVHGSIICAGELQFQNGERSVTVGGGIYTGSEEYMLSSNPSRNVTVMNPGAPYLNPYVGMEFTGDWIQAINEMSRLLCQDDSGNILGYPYGYGMFPVDARKENLLEAYYRWDLGADTLDAATALMNEDPEIQAGIFCDRQEWRIEGIQASEGNYYFPVCNSYNRGHIPSGVPMLPSNYYEYAMNDPEMPRYYSEEAMFVQDLGSTVYSDQTALKRDVTFYSYKPGTAYAYLNTLSTVPVITESCTLELVNNYSSNDEVIFIDPTAGNYTSENPMMILLDTSQCNPNSRYRILVNNNNQYEPNGGGYDYSRPIPLERSAAEGSFRIPGKQDVLIFLKPPGELYSGMYATRDLYIMTTGAYSILNMSRSDTFPVIGNPDYRLITEQQGWEVLSEESDLYAYQFVPNVTIFGQKNTTYGFQNGAFFNANVCMPESVIDNKMTLLDNGIPEYRGYAENEPALSNTSVMVQHLGMKSLGTMSVGNYISFNGGDYVGLPDRNRPDPVIGLHGECGAEEGTLYWDLDLQSGNMWINGHGAMAAADSLEWNTDPNIGEKIRSVDVANAEDLTEIPENSFSGCVNLEEVRIPENVTQIGENAFANCPLLNRIEILNDDCEVDGMGLNSTATIYAPTKAAKAKAYADANGNPFVELFPTETTETTSTTSTSKSSTTTTTTSKSVTTTTTTSAKPVTTTTTTTTKPVTTTTTTTAKPVTTTTTTTTAKPVTTTTTTTSKPVTTTTTTTSKLVTTTTTTTTSKPVTTTTTTTTMKSVTTTTTTTTAKSVATTTTTTTAKSSATTTTTTAKSVTTATSTTLKSTTSTSRTTTSTSRTTTSTSRTTTSTSRTTTSTSRTTTSTSRTTTSTSRTTTSTSRTTTSTSRTTATASGSTASASRTTTTTRTTTTNPVTTTAPVEQRIPVKIVLGSLSGMGEFPNDFSAEIRIRAKNASGNEPPLTAECILSKPDQYIINKDGSQLNWYYSGGENALFLGLTDGEYLIDAVSLPDEYVYPKTASLSIAGQKITFNGDSSYTQWNADKNALEIVFQESHSTPPPVVTTTVPVSGTGSTGSVSDTTKTSASVPTQTTTAATVTGSSSVNTVTETTVKTSTDVSSDTTASVPTVTTSGTTGTTASTESGTTTQSTSGTTDSQTTTATVSTQTGPTSTGTTGTSDTQTGTVPTETNTTEKQTDTAPAVSSISETTGLTKSSSTDTQETTTVSSDTNVTKDTVPTDETTTVLSAVSTTTLTTLQSNSDVSGETTTTKATASASEGCAVRIAMNDSFGNDIEGAVLYLSGTTTTVDANGNPQEAAISFEKSSIEAEKATVISNQGGTLVWVSGSEETLVKNLADGNYTLRERTAPDGYETADDITFTIRDGQLVDINGEEVADGTVVVMICEESQAETTPTTDTSVSEPTETTETTETIETTETTETTEPEPETEPVTSETDTTDEPQTVTRLTAAFRVSDAKPLYCSADNAESFIDIGLSNYLTVSVYCGSYLTDADGKYLDADGNLTEKAVMQEEWLYQITDYLTTDAESPQQLWESEKDGHAHSYLVALFCDADEIRALEENGYLPEGTADVLFPKQETLHVADLQVYMGVLGDYNLDDEIRADDAQRALRSYADSDLIDREFRLLPAAENADEPFRPALVYWLISNVNGDDKLDAVDAQLILACYIEHLAGHTEITYADLVQPLLRLNVSRLTLNTDGDSKTYQLTAYYSDDVEWQSSDPDVVSVSADGLVTALKDGTAIITAKGQDAAAYCQVTVKTAYTAYIYEN